MKELIRLFKNYYMLDVFRMLRDMLLTKIFFPSSVRMIRQPAYIIGKKHIKFGQNFSSGNMLRLEVLDKNFVRHNVDFDGKPELIFGDNITLNNNVHIGVLNKISIGANTLVASNVLIIDHNHGTYIGDNQDSPLISPKDRKAIPKEVIIGKNVWISENVSILPGTIIGDGCIIGANSVVSGKFEENLIIAGTPARALKKFNDKTNSWERI
ncbi:DapH/DapD/GlmU-related protein [Aureivirga sp. CE67]|uniref:DapH/DapD/GlmU-related protein n=1 Tax=Aureivirga sp. CE67 TaxID=1788983 RepID=UPI0018CAB863|nr:DapH/DapD/GlmU-related protein [Aureivirga sp. CE67]